MSSVCRARTTGWCGGGGGTSSGYHHLSATIQTWVRTSPPAPAAPPPPSLRLRTTDSSQGSLCSTFRQEGRAVGTHGKWLKPSTTRHHSHRNPPEGSFVTTQCPVAFCQVSPLVTQLFCVSFLGSRHITRLMSTLRFVINLPARHSETEGCWLRRLVSVAVTAGFFSWSGNKCSQKWEQRGAPGPVSRGMVRIVPRALKITCKSKSSWKSSCSVNPPRGEACIHIENQSQNKQVHSQYFKVMVERRFWKYLQAYSRTALSLPS